MTNIYRTQLNKNILKSLLKKNNFKASMDLFIRIFLFGSFFFTSFYYLTINEYLIAWLFLILSSFIASFFSWAGIGHELLHYTVFTNRQVNRFFVVIFSTFLWNNWIYHEVSHRIHHRSTMISNIDYEFDPNQKPLSKLYFLSTLLFDYKSFYRALKITTQNALNIVKGPFANLHLKEGSSNRKKLVSAARLILTIHIIVPLLFTIAGFWQLAFLFTLCLFIATGVTKILALSQHVNMLRDDTDLRHNSRSVILPKWLEFLYANMNYHVEHHMYPNIPYYNLPKLNHLIKDNLPKREILHKNLKMVIS